MGNLLKCAGIGVIVSLFYFSFGLTFLPSNINTKMILAAVGVLLASYHAVKNRAIRISKPMLGAISIVVLFSLVCYVAVDYNHTTDYSYATYFISFAVWVFSAYTVCTVIVLGHGKVNITLLTLYLAASCFTQCVFAILIDNIPSFQLWVDTYIDQGQEFLVEVNRLYGIGASLDNAGVRFSIATIMIAAVLCKDKDVRNNQNQLILIILGYFVIIVVGNMISRTTSIGASLSLIYLIFNTGMFRLVIKRDYFRFHLIFGGILLLVILITTFLYQTDIIFHEQFRFAFEGFFNWIEEGEWRTGSTDKLNEHMWIWPNNLETWIIGTGLFENWIYGTDIGYCRLILYCGLAGFTVFMLFFIYHAIIFGSKYRQYWDMFLLFLILTFIVWIKVSTDIFIIYALFYCMEMFNTPKPQLSR